MRSYSFIVLCSFLLMSTVAKADEPMSAAEKRESRVYEAIADMAVRRDDLLRKFAVVLYGEGTVFGMKDGPHSQPVYFIRVVDHKRDFDLKAHFTVQDHRESGSELVRIGKKYKGRRGLFVFPYEPKPKDLEISKWREKYDPIGHDPYDDYLIGVYALESEQTYRQIEKMVLRRYQLEKAVRGINDIFMTTWTSNPNKLLDLTVDIHFHPAFEMMPTRLSVANSALKNHFEEMRIRWGKVGSKAKLLPTVIEVSRGDLSRPNVQDEYTLKCKWLVGDEIPDDLYDYIDPDENARSSKRKK